MIFTKLLTGSSKQRHEDRKADLYRNLIRREARIGGELFGPVRPGGRREFFCLDEHTWVWHEEWVDSAGERHIKTTRYDVRPNGILKAQDGQHYQQVSREEARHLRQAVDTYVDRVKHELYAAVA
jgi:hypothetical protein